MLICLFNYIIAHKNTIVNRFSTFFHKKIYFFISFVNYITKFLFVSIKHLIRQSGKANML